MASRDRGVRMSKRILVLVCLTAAAAGAGLIPRVRDVHGRRLGPKASTDSSTDQLETLCDSRERRSSAAVDPNLFGVPARKPVPPSTPKAATSPAPAPP